MLTRYSPDRNISEREAIQEDNMMNVENETNQEEVLGEGAPPTSSLSSLTGRALFSQREEIREPAPEPSAHISAVGYGGNFDQNTSKQKTISNTTNPNSSLTETLAALGIAPPVGVQSNASIQISYVRGTDADTIYDDSPSPEDNAEEENAEAQSSETANPPCVRRPRIFPHGKSRHGKGVSKDPPEEDTDVEDEADVFPFVPELARRQLATGERSSLEWLGRMFQNALYQPIHTNEPAELERSTPNTVPSNLAAGPSHQNASFSEEFEPGTNIYDDEDDNLFPRRQPAADVEMTDAAESREEVEEFVDVALTPTGEQQRESSSHPQVRLNAADLQAADTIVDLSRKAHTEALADSQRNMANLTARGWASTQHLRDLQDEFARNPENFWAISIEPGDLSTQFNGRENVQPEPKLRNEGKVRETQKKRERAERERLRQEQNRIDWMVENSALGPGPENRELTRQMLAQSAMPPAPPRRRIRSSSRRTRSSRGQGGRSSGMSFTQTAGVPGHRPSARS
jgi:hypothetical protein